MNKHLLGPQPLHLLLRRLGHDFLPLRLRGTVRTQGKGGGGSRGKGGDKRAAESQGNGSEKRAVEGQGKGQGSGGERRGRSRIGSEQVEERQWKAKDKAKDKAVCCFTFFEEGTGSDKGSGMLMPRR